MVIVTVKVVVVVNVSAVPPDNRTPHATTADVSTNELLNRFALPHM
jgi:hypothetical protein